MHAGQANYITRQDKLKPMAKPIEYVTELNEEEAKAFIEEYLHPKPNPARDKFIAEAMALREELKNVK